jgi:SH3 domain-containing YSC84-like protein 1
VSSRHTRSALTRASAALAALAIVLLASCYRNAVPTPGTSPEQVTVDRATLAMERMRKSGEFPELEARLRTASAVMIFPRVVKAALVLGGSGGHGVLLARDALGDWSPPAFFNLGGGSAGLELGYQEATVVLVFANRPALLTVIDRGLTLGADVTLATGTIGTAGASATATAARDVYTYVDVGGVFAGVALDGAVVDASETRNQDYYGPGATVFDVVINEKYDNADSRGLRAVLAGG